MKEPSVSLAIADTQAYVLANNAIQACTTRFEFQQVHVFTDAPQYWPQYHTILVDKMLGIEDYNRIILEQLPTVVEADFCLVVQYDGFILNAQSFSEDFYNFDYIGAVWPNYPQHRVGNGGFSWRSRKLMKAVAQLSHLREVGQPEDLFICRTIRDELEADYGCVFADETTAMRFSCEAVPHDQPSFGFHGIFNLPVVYRNNLKFLMDNLPPTVVAARLPFLRHRTQLLDKAQQIEFENLLSGHAGNTPSADRLSGVALQQSINRTTVLSFCIPTYNRSSHLRELLQSIVLQAVFLETDKVEIVIGDNCSSDDTAAVAQEFQSLYGSKIRYFRNDTNLEDLNFERVLRAGTGAFLKLLNDSVVVRDGVVDLLVQLVEGHAAEKPIFYSANKQIQSDARVLVCSNVNDFIAAASYGCTWIGGFGIWHSDLEEMTEFSRRRDFQLVQVDALFRQFVPGRRCLILNETHYEERRLAAKKGGYSVARVFGKNYLLLLREQVQSGRLQESTYQLEKKRVLLEQILPYYFSPEHDFTRGRLSEYLVDYLEEDYFYVELEHRQYGALQTSYASLSGMTRLQRRWRLLNGHNGSQLAAFSGITPFEKVFVGNGTYGDLHIWEFGQPDERLQIGHYCSIAADVHFLLGGNDDYETVSTYPFRVKNFGEPMEASTKGPIVLSDDVWLGHRALILSGVRIGQGAIVAAGSVVTKNVEPYSIVAGNPARHVKFRFTKDVRDKLLLVDYSQLSADRLGALRGALQEPVNSVSVDQIVNALRGESIEHKDHSLNAHEGWGLK